MSLEVQHAEFPYTLNIETAAGQAVAVPIAFLTREELATFLQTDFKRLANEAGLRGARIHVEQAATADYGNVLEAVSAYLRRAALKTVEPRSA